jgi:hypothetical protein
MGRFYQQDTLGVNPAGGLINPFSIIKQYSDGMNLYQPMESKVVTCADPLGLRTFFIRYQYDSQNLKGIRMPKGICAKMEKILSPCFSKLECDKIDFACVKKTPYDAPPLGILSAYDLPKAVIFAVFFDGTVYPNNNKAAGRGAGYVSEIYPRIIDVGLSRNITEEELANLYANIVVHESIWEGLFNKTGHDKTDSTKLGYPYAETTLITLTFECKHCKDLRKIFKLKPYDE